MSLVTRTGARGPKPKHTYMYISGHSIYTLINTSNRTAFPRSSNIGLGLRSKHHPTQSRIQQQPRSNFASHTTALWIATSDNVHGTQESHDGRPISVCCRCGREPLGKGTASCQWWIDDAWAVAGRGEGRCLLMSFGLRLEAHVAVASSLRRAVMRRARYGIGSSVTHCGGVCAFVMVVDAFLPLWMAVFV